MNVTIEISESEVSTRLERIRKELGVSQRYMAEATGCDQASWSGYETGKNLPGAKVLARLAGLGFNLNWVVSGQGNMRGVSVNTELMIQVTRELMSELDERGIRPQPEKLGELISLIYSLFENVEQEEQRTNITRQIVQTL